MSEWKQKRFWKAASVIACDGGCAIELDGRAVKTPAKANLVVPTKAMADAIAAEWDAQGEVIDPSTMPVTRGANAAIDKVRVQKDEVVAMLAEYGDSDLLCYRAVGPESLIERQAEHWDPVLKWAAEALGVQLRVAEGVMHIAQDRDALSRLAAMVAEFDPFALAGVHDLVSISGSLVTALAVTQHAISPEDAWTLSRVDEHWQVEQWGEDDEATANEAIKRAAFLAAAQFYEMSLP